MTLSEHRWTPTNQQMVEGLREQYPEVRTGGRAVKEMLAAFPELVDATFHCVPDGMVWDTAERRIDLFEIEVTHAIPRTAMWAICDLWVLCDNVGIDLSLYVVNRYGHVNQMELGPWYLSLLQARTD